MLQNCALATLFTSLLAAPAPLDAGSMGTCFQNYDGPFGISIEPGLQTAGAPPIAAQAAAIPAAMQIADGQVQVQPGVGPAPPNPVAQIADGQVQVQQGVGPAPPNPVAQIDDGQVQIQNTQLEGASSGPCGEGIDCLPGTIEINLPPQMAKRDMSPENSKWNGPISNGAPAGKLGYIQSCIQPGSLTMKLVNGELIDSLNRVAYISASNQFQFDLQAQYDALSEGGYSICNGYVYLDGDSTFYACDSGDFFNLYDDWIGGQCQPVRMRVMDMVDCKPL